MERSPELVITTPDKKDPISKREIGEEVRKLNSDWSVYHLEGNFEKAKKESNQLYAKVKDSANFIELTDILSIRAWSTYYFEKKEGIKNTAHTIAEKAIEMTLGTEMLANFHKVAGLSHLQNGDKESAKVFFDSSLELAIKSGNENKIGKVKTDLGIELNNYRL
jgi:hypothetical protein